ncbi:epithelial-stromal interaction protein 1-like [Ptychodera flava]|uniref:epithelial-stromal interaction protein 1-like n=1 Tax=Ptychodera flava TaxID=63121 RepID=UPI003969EB2B
MDQPSDGVSGQTSGDNVSDPRQGQTVQERFQHRGNYAMIAPNEKRRSQIQQQAEKETRQYEEYKERNKMGYISLPPQAVGGGTVVSQTGARQQQSLQHRQVTARLDMVQSLRINRHSEQRKKPKALERKQRHVCRQRKIKNGNKQDSRDWMKTAERRMTNF